MTMNMRQMDVERNFKLFARRRGYNVVWIGTHKRGFLYGFYWAMGMLRHLEDNPGFVAALRRDRMARTSKASQRCRLKQARKAYEDAKQFTVRKCLERGEAPAISSPKHARQSRS